MCDLATGIQERFQWFETSLAAVAEMPNREAAHDLSTSLRRLLAADALLQMMFAKALFRRKHAASLNRLRSVLVQVRDAQEMPLKLDELLPPEHRAYAGLERLLRKHRILVSEQLCLSAERFRIRHPGFSQKCGKRLQRVLNLPIRREPVAFLREQQQEMAEGLERVLQREDKSIHRLRIQFKYFRYVVELVAKADPARNDWMGIFQTLLGEVHDWQVLQEFTGKKTAGRKKYTGFCDMLNKRLTRETNALEDYLLSHRDEILARLRIG